MKSVVSRCDVQALLLTT